MNAGWDTIVDTASLGGLLFDNPYSQDGLWQVTAEDRAAGYDLAYFSGRTGTEILAGLGLGKLAQAPGYVGKLAFALDTAGNVVTAGRGVQDASANGLNWQNGVQIVGGLLGTGGNVAGRWGGNIRVGDAPRAASGWVGQQGRKALAYARHIGEALSRSGPPPMYAGSGLGGAGSFFEPLRRAFRRFQKIRYGSDELSQSHLMRVVQEIEL